jgi:hypothetical protein
VIGVALDLGDEGLKTPVFISCQGPEDSADKKPTRFSR